jgi:hypothetical protein
MGLLGNACAEAEGVARKLPQTPRANTKTESHWESLRGFGIPMVGMDIGEVDKLNSCLAMTVTQPMRIFYFGVQDIPLYESQAPSACEWISRFNSVPNKLISNSCHSFPLCC